MAAVSKRQAGAGFHVDFSNGRIRPIFGGHEKFAFRHGWLKKGVEAVAHDPVIFTHDLALVRLGVGKNMVRAIRHWCLVTGLLDEATGPGKSRPLKLTRIGEALCLDNGWDPYLEDTGTLWLLHWQLISNPERALVWRLVFSAYLDAEFTKKQLGTLITKRFQHLGIRTTEATIEREIDCCLRTYVPAMSGRQGISEEGLDCPLAELELIRFFPEAESYRFNIGPKASLPAAIFGFAALTCLPRLARSRRTVAVDELVYQDGSPGQAFKLDENSVVEYLEWLERFTDGGVRLQETAGLRQAYLHQDVDDMVRCHGTRLLQDYYERGL